MLLQNKQLLTRELVIYMAKFICNKIGRDKGLESFTSQGVKVEYKLLEGQELQSALKDKLLEESQEVFEASNIDDITEELADVLEVINCLCKAYKIKIEELKNIQKEKYNKRGGFERGLFIKTLEIDATNPIIEHFRKSPDKYPEIE